MTRSLSFLKSSKYKVVLHSHHMTFSSFKIIFFRNVSGPGFLLLMMLLNTEAVIEALLGAAL